jgi:hypothetical protein
MNPGGRLLIIEMVLPAGDTPHPGKMLDMMMLVGPGGQERTEQEYSAVPGTPRNGSRVYESNENRTANHHE